jgi:hypothetical protein
MEWSPSGSVHPRIAALTRHIFRLSLVLHRETRLDTKGFREPPRVYPGDLRGALSTRGGEGRFPEGGRRPPSPVRWTTACGYGRDRSSRCATLQRIGWSTPRCRSLHRRGRLPNWTSRDTISPRMSRFPRASRPISRGVAAPLDGGRPSPPRGSSEPSSVGAANRTVSPRMCRGVRLDPTKVRAQLPRLALPTERYRRGCAGVSVWIRPRFVRILPRFGLPTERYRRGSSEVSVWIRPRFVRTLPRFALPTERYRRGCSGVSVWIRPRFVRVLPRLALPTKRYRRGCSEVSVWIRRRFVAISVGILHGAAEVAAVPSEDRVPHLSI